MNEILSHLPPDRLIEIGIAIGLYLASRLTSASRRSQGERLGSVEDRVSRLEGKLGAPPTQGSDGNR